MPTTESNIPDETPQTTDSVVAETEVTAAGTVTTEVTEEEITKFFNKDSAAREQVVEKIVPLDFQVIRSTVEDLKVHTIANFLERYVVVARAEWNTTTAAVSDLKFPTNSYVPNLISANFPNAIIAGGLDNSHNVYEKLTGQAFLRSGVNVALMVNAQKFQAGRLIIYAVPYPDSIGNRAFLQQTNAISVTQLPHAFLDLQGTANLVNIYLPHCGPYVQYDIVNADPILWQINVACFNALQDPSGNTVTVSLWGNLDHPQHRMPTGYAAGSAPTHYTTFYKTALPTNKYVEVRSAEAKTSSGASVIGQGVSMAAAVAGAIMPEAKPVVGAINAVVQGAVGVAQMLGFSKPQHTGTQQHIVIDNTPDFASVDGTAHGNSMSAYKFNSAPTAKGIFASDHDEMNFRSIAMRPTYIDKFEWSNTQPEETNLYLYNQSYNFMRQATVTSKQVFQLTPYSFLASLFFFWRGSVVLTFSAVKTLFHSGRLEIIWAPNTFDNSSTTTIPPTLDVTKCVRAIWDISETPNISLILPYNGQLPYKQTISNLSWTGTAWSLDNACGVVYVRVLNKLQVASSSVNPMIEINVLASAGPDCDYQCPRRPNWTPYNQLPSLFRNRFVEPCVRKDYKAVNDIVRIQGISTGSNKYHQMLTSPVNSLLNNNVSFNSKAPMVCFGEIITSLRQMVKRNMRIIEFQQITSPLTKKFVISPNPTVNMGDGLPTDYLPDWISLTQTLFAFRKGGLNFVMEADMNVFSAGTPPISTTSTIGVVTADLILDLVSPFDTTITPSTTPCGIVPVDPGMEAVTIPVNMDIQGFVRLEVPYYSQFPCLFNELHIGSQTPYWNQAKINLGEQPMGLLAFYFNNQSSTGPGYDLRIYRSAKDDWDCGFFLGVPQMLVADLTVDPDYLMKHTPPDFPRYQYKSNQASQNLMDTQKILSEFRKARGLRPRLDCVDEGVD